MNINTSNQVNNSFAEEADRRLEDRTGSLEGLQIIQIVNHLILSGLVCLFGITTNTINIVVFLKQGLDNTVNISMFAIAVSDLCGLVTLEWLNINVNPFMENADLPFEPSEVQTLTGGWPHACFLQITIWITVFVTAERFVCVAVPLKVKLYFTPFKTTAIIIAICLMTALSVAPEYISFYFGEKFIRARNETRIGLKVRSVSKELAGIQSVLTSVIGFVSFIVLIIFTFLLVIGLRRRLNFHRRITLDEEKIQAMSMRDRKTMKLVITLAFLMIICAMPGMILTILGYFVSEFGYILNAATWSVAFLAEAINSSVGIFLFYKMSSKFRRKVQELCVLRKNTLTGIPGYIR